MKRGKVANRLLDFYVGIPVLNMLASFRRKRTLPNTISRIGILVNPALGDTLLSSAPVQDVRSLYPDAILVFFAAKSNLSAAELIPGIDELRVLPITKPRQAIRILKEAHLDVLLDFTSWQRLTAFLTLNAGARFTVGFKRDGQYRHRGYDVTAPHRGDCHELENMRRITRLLGAQAHADPCLKIPVTSAPDLKAAGERIVIFHAWATGTFHHLREWPEENWVELAKRLRTEQRRFLLTGGPSDVDSCQSLSRKLAAEGIPVDIMIGRGGLTQVIEALRKAEVLISVNTGIMHLGAIIGVPTIALNGPNSEHRWGPIGPSVENVPTIDGSGGFLDLGYEFKGRNVMNKISVERVVDAVQRLSARSALKRALIEVDAR